MKKFDQYVSHLRILSRAFDEDLTNDFIVSGIIDKYYIQFELGWKVLKELLRYEGANQAATGSPREIIKTAYAYYDFIDESVWLGMLRDRNDTTHIYNEEAIAEFVLEQAKEYDTYGKKRKFTTVQGIELNLSSGAYGWKTDREEEIKALTEAIQNGSRNRGIKCRRAEF